MRQHSFKDTGVFSVITARWFALGIKGMYVQRNAFVFHVYFFFYF